MLGYLDALIAALSVRDSAEAQRLLAHPLARLLPDDVIAEATGFLDGRRDALAAPLRAMQLRYQTSELLRDAPLAADQPEPPVEATLAAAVPSASTASVARPAMRSRRANRQQQMELPLSA